MPKLIPEQDLPTKGIDHSASTLRRLEASGKFPRRVKISERKCAYVETEIDQYINKLVDARGR